MPQKVNYEHLPKPAGPYVHSAKYNGTLYVSGLTALGTESQKLDLLSQTNNVLGQINHILTIENKTQADLIKLTIFIKDIAKLASIRESLLDFYDGDYPASSLVEVSNLIHPDCLIEIEAIIALD